MSRKPRICYEGGWYHVFNRSNARKTLYFSDDFYSFFLELLEQVHIKYDFKIHAYCIMKNHYHLLIHTPKNNLSKGMWYLGRRFGMEVNKYMNADGPVFKSRFCSLVIEKEKYLLNLSRYIHRNPVEAQLVTHSEEYNWSSYKSYLNLEKPPIFLSTSKILKCFISQEEYKDYVNLGIDNGTKTFFGKTRLPKLFHPTKNK